MSKMFTIVPSALLLAVSFAAVGCGDDEKEDTSGGNGSDGGSGGAETRTVEATLVTVAEPVPIETSHSIELWDSEQEGEPKEVIASGTSGAGGAIKIEGVPADLIATIYIKGEGGETDGTYDTIILNVPPDTGDPYLRISNSGTADIVQTLAGFTSSQDAAAFSGAVYWTPEGNERKGVVGCAEIFLDDKDGQDEDSAQRYISAAGLPTAYDESTGRVTTHPQNGQFYFGNMPLGKHTLKVSLDGGETFIGETTFDVTRARKDAKSEKKAMLYQIGIDIREAANPTASDCK